MGNLELVPVLKGLLKDPGSCCPSIQGHKVAIPVPGKVARGQLCLSHFGELSGEPNLVTPSYPSSVTAMLGWPTLPAKESGISSILTGHVVASNKTEVLWGRKRGRPQHICHILLGIVERIPWEMSNSWPIAWRVTIITNWDSFQCLPRGGSPSKVASGDLGSSLSWDSPRPRSCASDSCLIMRQSQLLDKVFPHLSGPQRHHLLFWKP